MLRAQISPIDLSGLSDKISVQKTETWCRQKAFRIGISLTSTIFLAEQKKASGCKYSFLSSSSNWPELLSVACVEGAGTLPSYRQLIDHWNLVSPKSFSNKNLIDRYDFSRRAKKERQGACTLSSAVPATDQNWSLKLGIAKKLFE